MYARSWGPGGFSTGGTTLVDGWAQSDASFSVNSGATPDTPPHIDQNGSINESNPTYDWGHSEDVSWYQVWMGTSTGATAYYSWLGAWELNCYDDNVCNLDLVEIGVPDGTYTAYIQGYNPNGLTSWTGGQPFTIGD